MFIRTQIFSIFTRLLKTFAKSSNSKFLFQIAVPSRTDVKEYQDLKEEMDRLVGRINGRFSTSMWSPIRYRYGCVSQAELAGLYRYCWRFRHLFILHTSLFHYFGNLNHKMLLTDKLHFLENSWCNPKVIIWAFWWNINFVGSYMSLDQYILSLWQL